MASSLWTSLKAPAPTARRVQLPDGRYIAWSEQGVPREQARHCFITLHGGPDSRLTGIPGVSDSLLEEYGIHVVSYDRPGYGQSDYHPGWNLRSAALDIEHLASALNLPEKFWVLGYSGGGPYAWAAARYIPHRLAGVAQWAPDVNPWLPSVAGEDSRAMWRDMPSSARLRYVSTKWSLRLFPPWLVHYLFPPVLARATLRPLVRAPLLRASLSYTGPRDRAKLSDPEVMAALEESVREALRQGDLRAIYEDLAVPAVPWGFDLPELRIFPGPIHVWQGDDDRDVPLVLTVRAVGAIPGAQLHILEGEGHFSKFVSNEPFHREFFQTLFGSAQ